MTAMEWITVSGIGVGLAMDAFAIAVVSGAVYRQLHIGHALRMALLFGGFQAVMPIIGWAAGQTFKTLMTTYDHWIAFILLMVVGGKMIYEAVKIKEVEDKPLDPSNLMTLLTLGVATSIDALVVGITLSLVTPSIFQAVSIIGSITFLICFAGWELGKRAGHIFENKIEIAGGVIIILIGLKIFIAHLWR